MVHRLQVKLTRPHVPPPSTTPRRDGIVLVVVLVLVVMLALAGFGFLASMSTEYEATRLHGQTLQGHQSLGSAEEFAMWFCTLPRSRRDALGGWKNNSALFRGKIVQHPNADNTPGVSPAEVSIPEAPSFTETPSITETSSITEPSSLISEISDDNQENDPRWRFSMTAIESDEGEGKTLRFGLHNESARLHLADVLRWETESPGYGRTALMRIPGITESVADAILDWIDSDDQPREFGAESEFYLQLDRPYAAANRIPGVLEELLFVRGITRSNLFGSSGTIHPADEDLALLNSLNQPSNDSLPTQFSGEGSDRSSGFSGFLTVYSAERNVSRSGRNRIFLNQDNLGQLAAQMTDSLPPELVRFILLSRIHGVSLPGDGTQTAGGLQPLAAPFDPAAGPAHRIDSPLSLIDASIRIQSPSGDLIVASPLKSDSDEFPGTLSRLIDLTTTSPSHHFQGRVNFQEASPEVLAAVPGINSELAAQIISLREAEPDQHRDTTWLLTGKLVTLAEYRKLSDRITAGGDVFQADITVFRATGGPVLRRMIIIDGATVPARRLHWVNRDDLSTALPISLLMPHQL